MRRNKALQIWRQGGQSVGAWLCIANALSAEMMAHLGYDWLCVDLQHGMVSYDDLKYMLPAISTTDTIPLVRVTSNEASEIMKVLDAGAYGVIVPMVNNRLEAERAVSACRYPPQGVRSFGPIRALLYGGTGYASEANQEIACVLMIETKEGLDNLEEIVATEGVDGIYVGPSDLALGLGLKPFGQFDEPIHKEAVERIYNVCRDAGVAVGIHTGSLDSANGYLEKGFNFVTLGTDGAYMARIASEELYTAKKHFKSVKLD